jgi:hypothetical protein
MRLLSVLAFAVALTCAASAGAQFKVVQSGKALVVFFSKRYCPDEVESAVRSFINQNDHPIYLDRRKEDAHRVELDKRKKPLVALPMEKVLDLLVPKPKVEFFQFVLPYFFEEEEYFDEDEVLKQIEDTLSCRFHHLAKSKD